jgi:two-component system sensor histidine kinase/response regulator
MSDSSDLSHSLDLLIVDDDADLREMLSFYFTNLGYQVEAVANGTDALAICRRTPPHLILLDVNLPGPRGYDVYKAVRELPECNTTSIIFLTMYNTRDERLAGLGLGADDYIGKPFDVQELRLRVEHRLGRF